MKAFQIVFIFSAFVQAFHLVCALWIPSNAERRERSPAQRSMNIMYLEGGWKVKVHETKDKESVTIWHVVQRVMFGISLLALKMTRGMISIAIPTILVYDYGLSQRQFAVAMFSSA